MARTVSSAALSRARNVFLASLMLCVTYYITWQFWRWSEVPGFIFLLGSMPWTLPWLDWLEAPVNRLVGWHVRAVLDVLFISLGFSLNCALAYFILAIWKRPGVDESPT